MVNFSWDGTNGIERYDAIGVSHHYYDPAPAGDG